MNYTKLMITKIRKEMTEFLLHMLVLPPKSMQGKYKDLFTALSTTRAYRGFRYLLGPKLSRLLIGNIYFDNSIYGIDFKMIDDGVFEYYILYSRNEIYEPALVKKLKEILEENKSYTFVDIGSHYGYFTIIAGNVLGPGGNVISIEPNPKCYNRLLENIHINKLNGIVKTYNIGLSENKGRATMGSWDNRKTINDNSGDIVLVSFDELCRKEQITPNIVKIDVFGAEGNILSGMSSTLNQVSHLLCELHEDMNGYTARDIINMMEYAGLEVFEFTKHRHDSGGEIVPIKDEFFSDHVDRMLYGRRRERLN